MTSENMEGGAVEKAPRFGAMYKHERVVELGDKLCIVTPPLCSSRRECHDTEIEVMFGKDAVQGNAREGYIICLRDGEAVLMFYRQVSNKGNVKFSVLEVVRRTGKETTSLRWVWDEWSKRELLDTAEEVATFLTSIMPKDVVGVALDYWLNWDTYTKFAREYIRYKYGI